MIEPGGKIPKASLDYIVSELKQNVVSGIYFMVFDQRMKLTF